MKALILIAGIGIAAASAADLRISFEPPRNVAAIRFLGRDISNPQIVVYGEFQLAQRDVSYWFKATECLHVMYPKDIPLKIAQSGREEGKIEDNDVQSVMRFPETLKEVRQIDIVNGKNGLVMYVFSKAEILRVVFKGDQESKSEKISEHDVPAIKPRLNLVVPQENGTPTFK
jgi:hypothetical protein